MYENMTYEALLERCLARVPETLDKREGSIIFDALSPVCAQLAALYTELSNLLDRSFPDTATGTDLERKAAERSITRQKATRAVRAASFSGGEPPLGARFSGGGLNYVLTALPEAGGAYQLTAESAGAVGNRWFGALLPIDFIEGLTGGQLGPVLIPGEDEEEDEALRKRYFDSFERQAFGGNLADYKARVGALPGVGGVKALRAPQGGGTVGVIILGSDWAPPTPQLVQAVQTAVDPTLNQGGGVGLAPIGHRVTVSGVEGRQISVAARLTLEQDITWEDVYQAVRDAIQAYFTTLAQAWADSETTTVRVSQIETRILCVAGVLDVEALTLNGSAANLALEGTEIPVLGEVSHAAV
jgi:uncharacterized phage protein gp47/JayE